MCVYVTITVKEKDIMKLKGSKGEIWEGLEEGEKK